jgi:SWI/SNF-related matrix-associated actin-dependent regulator 1 of chromatin subfamily A
MPDVRMIQQAVRYLESRCDGAISEDGHGFNKTDASFGKSLAEQERWTKLQAQAALKMLKKYQRQLQAGGFDIERLFDGSEITYPHLQQEKVKQMNVVKKVDDRTMEIRYKFDPEILQLVKTLPGRRFHPDKKYWTAIITADSINKLKDAGFVIDAELEKLLHQAEEMEKEIEVSGLKKQLFPFQKVGVAFIEKRNGRALIADEMGLGKTIQAAAWLQLHPEKRPAIILCPASLKLNWAKEIRETLSTKDEVQILQGTKPYPITEDIIIINYDILNSWVETLQAINPQVLIIDEAHYIKNSSAIRTKATKKLAKGIPHVIALTGTPIVNRPIEGFNIFQILDRNLFPNFWTYVHQYCGARHNGFGWDFSGATNKEELNQILTSTIMIRRRKANVLKDLPEKMYSFVPMELSNETEYRIAEEEFIEYLRGVKGKEAAEKAKKAEHLVKIEALKQLAVKGKMKQAINWIRDFIEDGSKLVVFAVHKEVIDKLMNEFKGVAVKLYGECSQKERNEAVERFQNDPNIKLFIGNIQAAGVGLTLTAASAVAFLELPWTPGELQQAEDRCHRIGQKNAVNIYYLLAENSVEYKLARLLDKKKKVLSAVIDGKLVEEKSLISELIESYQEGKEAEKNER